MPPQSHTESNDAELVQLSSVEITESAKGEVRASKVKVYHSSPAEASRQAVEIMFRTRKAIKEAAEAETAAQLQASAEAANGAKAKPA